MPASFASNPVPGPEARDFDAELAAGHRVIDAAVDGLARLRSSLGPNLLIVARHLSDCRGRLVFSGMGKSGIAARKMAATFASVGKPALFLHPADAVHGDLGKMCAGDMLIAISVSGESRPLLPLLHYARDCGIATVALTARDESSIAVQADHVLMLPGGTEGGPIAAMPMASTVATIVLGDALAALVANRNQFSESDLAVLHPGGRIGHRLRPVRQIMHAGERMPLIGMHTPGGEVVAEISRKGFGLAGVVDPATQRLVGVVSDGDLRRNLNRIETHNASDLMSPHPVSLSPHETADQALDLARSHRVGAIFVIDPANGVPLGVVDLQDLLRVSVD